MNDCLCYLATEDGIETSIEVRIIPRVQTRRPEFGSSFCYEIAPLIRDPGRGRRLEWFQAEECASITRNEGQSLRRGNCDK